MADNKTLYVLQVARDQIVACDTSGIEEFVRDTLSDGEKTLGRINRITFAVSGYDDDPRELGQIPEVRKFFAQLNEIVPTFFYLLEPVNRMTWLAVSSDVEYVEVDGQLKIGFDVAPALELIKKCWTASNQRFHEQGICDDPIVKAQDKAIHDWIRVVAGIDGDTSC